MKLEIYTIGHSNHELTKFLELLEGSGIEAVADIRRFPSSRTFPHFNRQELAAALAERGIAYHWIEALGGRRGVVEEADPVTNAGLRNKSFRQYADYMQTESFRQGIEALAEIAAQRRTALMCSESVFWRCHRRLVSDFVLAGGGAVQHVFPGGEVKPHALTDGARAMAGRVTYPEPLPLFDSGAGE